MAKLPDHPAEIALAGLVAQAATEARDVAEWVAILRDPDRWDSGSRDLKRWGDRLIAECKAADIQPEALTRWVLGVCERIEKREAEQHAILAAVEPAGRG